MVNVVRLFLLFNLCIYPNEVVANRIGIASHVDKSEIKELPLIDYILESTKIFSALDLNTIGVTLAVDDPNYLFAGQDLVSEIVIGLMKNNFKVVLDYGNITRADQPRFINILYFDSFAAFLRLSPQFTEDAIDFRGYFIMIVASEHASDAPTMCAQIFDILWEKKVTNVAILTEHGEVFTYFPYQPQNSCNRIQTIQIDDLFSNDSRESTNIFPPKFDNFFGCEITVSTFDNLPYLAIKELTNGSVSLNGIEGIILRVLAQTMNFTINVKYPEDGEKWGFLDADGHSTGGLKTVLDGKAQFAMSGYARNLYGPEVDSSSIYYFAYLIMLVPPGRHYTAIEIFFLPFRSIVWTMFLGIFITGFAIICVTGQFRRCQPLREFQDSPYLNMLNVFLGGAVTKPPKIGVARFLLVLWIWYCFVIRNMYQAKLFEHLQSVPRKAPVKSFDEAVGEDFYFYMGKEANVFFESFPAVLERSLFIIGDIPDFADELLDPNTKRGFLSTTTHTAYFNKLHGANGTMNSIPRKVLLLPICIIYPKHSPIKASMDQKIAQFISGGLIELWASQFASIQDLKEREEQSAPAQLKMADLKASFEILTIGWLVTSLVLVVEKLYYMKHKGSLILVELTDPSCGEEYFGEKC